MPAASYREGPDGHSSRKQNSKRRRAKCSPSFVSGRVIGHGDISPRCIPECSAMARCTAPYPLLAPAAPALCLSCFWRGVLQVLPSAPFFCGEGGSYLVRGESKRSSMARSSRMRSRATGSGNILARCVPERLSVARFRRGAFSGGNPWQVLRSMHSESGLGRENRQFVTRFARHASEMSWLWQDMRAMHPKSPANSCLGIHRAKILPSVVVPNRPSARDPGTAEQCEPPELDRPAQETQPGRQRPRRFLGSKYRQQLPRRRHRSLPTPASSLSPRRTTPSLPTAPPVEAAPAPPPPR